MTNKPPHRDIRLVFKEHEEEGFKWFCYNPNGPEIADEIKDLLSAYDALQAELGNAKKEVESLTQERDELKEALKSVPHDRLCAIVGGYGYGYCTCYKRELAKLEGKE